MTDRHETASTINEHLERLRDELRSVSLGEIANHNPDHLPVYLAARFEYDVRQGGFTQLLFNMRGEYLSEIEDILIAANAEVAREHYVRAIKACLANTDDYQAFLDSNYVDGNPLKNELHSASLDYLARDVPFAVEVHDFLTRNIGAGSP